MADGKIIVSGSTVTYAGDDPNDKDFFETANGTGTAATDLLLAYPTGQDGWYAVVGATDTFWVWDTGTSAWVNSGSTAGMAKATYDPNNIQDDAFDMDNMVEGATNLILTDAERTKLSGIEAGAEVNVKADWNGSGDDSEILNKPTIPASTADLPDSLNKRYVTDAQLAEISNYNPSSYTNVIFVDKSGNDSFNGTIETPFLTITAALAAASSGYEIFVNPGVYDEDFTVSNGIFLNAHGATIIGEVTLATGSKMRVYKHYSETTGTATVLLSGSSGHAYYEAELLDTRGQSGTLTGVLGLVNGTSGGILFANIKLLFVGEDSGGIADAISGFGHIHFNVMDLYLAGDNAVGVGPFTNGSNMIGFIDHVLEINSPTGTTAISVNASSVVKITANEIIADTAYNVTAGGELYLRCPLITGTKTGTNLGEIGDYRRNMSVAANGSAGQTISYSSTFINVRPVIFDYEGLGIEVTAFDADGFTITSLTAGNFGYETKADK